MPNATPATKRAKAEAAELRVKLDEHIKLDRERRKEIKALRKQLSEANRSLKDAIKGRDQTLSAQETLYGENCKLQQELESGYNLRDQLREQLADREAALEKLRFEHQASYDMNELLSRDIKTAEADIATRDDVIRALYGDIEALSERLEAFLSVTTFLTERLSRTEKQLDLLATDGK